MKKEIYLLDANGFITPSNVFYQFSFAPTFWNLLEKHIENGDIAVLDVVYNELLDKSGENEYPLIKWAASLNIPLLAHQTPERVKNWVAVINYISTCGYYNQSAMEEWSKDDKVADPWLIAAAMTDSTYTIVTLEKKNTQRQIKNPCKKAKIPDIAADMNIKCIDLFDMMKNLNFIL